MPNVAKKILMTPIFGQPRICGEQLMRDRQKAKLGIAATRSRRVRRM
jgi:hypothetical protein